MTKVRAMMRFASMPMSPATCGLCAVALIAVPSRVRYTSAASPAIIASEIARMAICTLVMVAPAKWYDSTLMICGKASGLRLQIIIARCCRMIDTPIAVIRGASRGAPRNGRYAARSIA